MYDLLQNEFDKCHAKNIGIIYPCVRVICQDGTVSVCLCDTSGKDDLHINDILVEEGYAVFAPDDWKTGDKPDTSETNDKSSSSVPVEQIAPAALEPDLRYRKVLRPENEQYLFIEQYLFNEIEFSSYGWKCTTSVH